MICIITPSLAYIFKELGMCSLLLKSVDLFVPNLLFLVMIAEKSIGGYDSCLLLTRDSLIQVCLTVDI